MREVAGPFRELIRTLAPLATSPTRVLVLGTASEYSALFLNMKPGWNPYAVALRLTRSLACRGLAVSIVDDTIDRSGGVGGSAGSVGFSVCDSGDEIRFVSAGRDVSRWVFAQDGEPLPFEDVAAYGARRVRDRLRPEAVAPCLGSLGVRLFDEAFFAPDGSGILLEDVSYRPSQVWTLEEARRDVLL